MTQRERLRLYLGAYPAPSPWNLACRVDEGLEIMRRHPRDIEAVSVPMRSRDLVELVIEALYTRGQMLARPRLEVRP